MRRSYLIFALLASVAISVPAASAAQEMRGMNKHDASIASYGYNIDIATNMGGDTSTDLRGDMDQGKAREGLMPKSAAPAPAPNMPMATLQAPTGGRKLNMYERPSQDPMLSGKPQPPIARVAPQARVQPRPQPQPATGVPEYAPVVPMQPPVAEAMPAPVAPDMPPQAGVMPPVPSPVQPMPPQAQPQMAPSMPQGQAPMPPQDEMTPRTMNFSVPPSNPAFVGSVDKGTQI